MNRSAQLKKKIEKKWKPFKSNINIKMNFLVALVTFN